MGSKIFVVVMLLLIGFGAWNILDGISRKSNFQKEQREFSRTYTPPPSVVWVDAPMCRGERPLPLNEAEVKFCERWRQDTQNSAVPVSGHR